MSTTWIRTVLGVDCKKIAQEFSQQTGASIRRGYVIVAGGYTEHWWCELEGMVVDATWWSTITTKYTPIVEDGSHDDDPGCLATSGNCERNVTCCWCSLRLSFESQGLTRRHVIGFTREARRLGACASRAGAAGSIVRASLFPTRPRWLDEMLPTITTDDMANALAPMFRDEPFVTYEDSTFRAYRSRAPAGGEWLACRRLDWAEISGWSDMQRMKNEILGDEVETVEVYPAESRLIDDANMRHMWTSRETVGLFRERECLVVTGPDMVVTPR